MESETSFIWHLRVSTNPHEAKEDPKMQVKQLEALSDLVLKYPATWFVDGWSVTLKFG